MVNAHSRVEVLQIAELIATEKGITSEQVIDAMEQAIQKAARAKYGVERDIRANIDRMKGDIQLLCYREIVEGEVHNNLLQTSLASARRIRPDAKVGEFLVESLPPIDFGRIAAQTAKQVIFQCVRTAERERQYQEYKDKVGKIVTGIVKRIDYGNITIDLGQAEAIIRRDEQIPRELLRIGDRTRAYIYEVRQEIRKPQIFLSRTRPEFMSALFAQEVPEIYDGVIEIKAVARDPGSRAKIAVISKDPSIDPVGACVGMRGSRVQAVVSELQGEKIDIVPWSPDQATFIVNAVAPAEVSKIVIDEDNNRVEVVLPNDQLSLAIGRRGQNVRLASILTGKSVDILTQEQESERRNEELRSCSQMFIEALDIDDVIAHLLVVEGFSTIDELAETQVDDLTEIEGFAEDIAQELLGRAKDFIKKRDEDQLSLCQNLGMTDDLGSVEELDLPLLVELVKKGIKSRNDLADLATDELLELLPEQDISRDKAEKIIMSARSHWFSD